MDRLVNQIQRSKHNLKVKLNERLITSRCKVPNCQPTYFQVAKELTNNASLKIKGVSTLLDVLDAINLNNNFQLKTLQDSGSRLAYHSHNQLVSSAKNGIDYNTILKSNQNMAEFSSNSSLNSVHHLKNRSEICENQVDSRILTRKIACMNKIKKKVTDQVVLDVITAIIHKIPMTMNFLKSGRRLLIN